jgi:hypothetical protein
MKVVCSYVLKQNEKDFVAQQKSDKCGRDPPVEKHWSRAVYYLCRHIYYVHKSFAVTTFVKKCWIISESILELLPVATFGEWRQS